MRTDGLFTVCDYTIKTNLDEPVWLRPVGDIHRDAELHADGEWQAWRKYAFTDPQKAVYIGMGDYADFMRAHVRAMSDHSEVENAGISERLQGSCDKWVETLGMELQPLADRFVGLLSGNHYFEFTDKPEGGKIVREHSDARLARLLGTKYLGTMSLITLHLVDIRNKANRAAVRVIAHHGVGAGGTIGGSLNRVQRMLTGWHADVALMGDDHRRGIVPIGDRLTVATSLQGVPTILANSKWVGRTGSFLRGFEPGKRSYVVDCAYEPSSIGTIEVEMKLRKNRKTGECLVALGGRQPA